MHIFVFLFSCSANTTLELMRLLIDSGCCLLQLDSSLMQVSKHMVEVVQLT